MSQSTEHQPEGHQDHGQPDAVEELVEIEVVDEVRVAPDVVVSDPVPTDPVLGEPLPGEPVTSDPVLAEAVLDGPTLGGPAAEGVVVVGRELADVVASIVTRIPGVARLHPGRFGEVVTLLPGRRVTGVRVVPAADGGLALGSGRPADALEVSVVVSPVRPVPETVADIRAALAPATSGRVDVMVADIDLVLPGEAASDRADPAPVESF